MAEIQLPQGTIRYQDEGTGPALVFIHGLLVDGRLWRKVVPELAKDFRCLVPDLPLGSHTSALNPDADLSPHGLAKLISDFLAALELEDVTLVGNDTGGGLCQIVVTRHPERIARLVLTPCDAFDNFPPRMFRPLTTVAGRVPGVLQAIGFSLRPAALRRSPLAFGWLAKHGIPDDLTADWLAPPLRDAGVRRDTRKVLRGIHPRFTREAAERLPGFDRPVLLAWAPEDRLFPYAHAERLAGLFPDARVERVEDSYTFVSEDQPQRLVELIAAFAREPAGAPAAR